MKFLPLLLANIGRKKLRTGFTLASIFVAFLVYALVADLRASFERTETGATERLITRSAVSLTQLLPLQHVTTLEKLPGVRSAAHMTFFAGYFRDLRDPFAQWAVDPERLFDAYPEIRISDPERQAWAADRTGAIIERSLTERYGWKIGDRIPIQGTIFRQRDGSSSWEFTVRGIFDVDEGAPHAGTMFFQYAYLSAAGLRTRGDPVEGSVQVIVVRPSSAERAGEVAAQIDSHFSTSGEATRTTTSEALARDQAQQIGNVSEIAFSISGVIFLTLLFVTANTMAQAFWERRQELGVLKALGFEDRGLFGLIVSESILLSALGGVPGLLAASWLSPLVIPDADELQALRAGSLVTGCLLIVAIGAAAGAVPAFRAMRLDVVRMLRSS